MNDYFETQNYYLLKKLINGRESVVKIGCIGSVVRLGQLNTEQFESLVQLLLGESSVHLSLLL